MLDLILLVQIKIFFVFFWSRTIPNWIIFIPSLTSFFFARLFFDFSDRPPALPVESETRGKVQRQVRCPLSFIHSEWKIKMKTKKKTVGARKINLIPKWMNEPLPGERERVGHFRTSCFSPQKKTHWKDHPIKTSGGSAEDRIEFDGSHRLFLS